jgi:hypothetical protein
MSVLGRTHAGEGGRQGGGPVRWSWAVGLPGRVVVGVVVLVLVVR